MRRGLAALVALALGLTATLGLTACSRKVRVESGTRYVCTYGESLGADVKQLEVPQSQASGYVVKTKTITCSRHQQAENLYLKAQAAIKAGDLKQAKTALEQTLKLDPKFKRGKEQLDQIAKGKAPAPDLTPAPAANTGPKPGAPGAAQPGGGTGTGAGDPTGSVAPGGTSPAMDAYRDLVPDTIGGFTAEALSAEELSLTRAYVPKDKKRYDQLVIMVQQYSSPGDAARGIDSLIKPSYPTSGAKVTVSGLSGYSGVNGQGFAILSLVNGGVLVSLELHATGVNGSELRGDLERIAEAVLD